MRTTLFLSSLFAVTLFGGVALAEKPTAEKPVREPRVVNMLRSLGDIVDKAYRGERPSHAGAQHVSAAPQQRAARAPHDRVGVSRINCSDIGGDCKYQSGKRPDSSAPAQAAPNKVDINKIKPPPGMLSKVLGNDRMACNEADDCTMGKAAVKRIWANAGGGAEAKGSNKGSKASLDPTGRVSQRFGERVRTDVDGARMSCNEAGECLMSSKTAQKIWAYESVKAGTWSPNKADDKNRNEKK
jgi:hypothetical protein